jgi:hypothetical protein
MNYVFEGQGQTRSRWFISTYPSWAITQFARDAAGRLAFQVETRVIAALSKLTAVLIGAF